MKKFFVIISLFLAAAGCTGQKKHNEGAHQQIASADTFHKPKVDVRVNKRYDDKGNLVQFDSTYSYFYSAPGLHKLDSISSDSLIGNFKFPLLHQYENLLDSNSNSIFFNDSMFKYDFYNNDYFSRRFHLNIPKFEELFRQMDSIKSEMFRNNYPGGSLQKKTEQ
jgi:hypothetical protein